MTITAQDLPAILSDHGKWLRAEDGGKPANLRGANLRGADLRGADLRGANLRGADLRGADLSGANLRGANLRGAGLRGADLSRADLSRADLREAHLSEADLSGANLRGANLREANLSEADLREAHLSGANLRGANLRGADLRGADLPAFQIPQEGSLIVWKAVVGGIAKLEIPADARRTACLINRKCRAEFVRTLAIVKSGGLDATSAAGYHNKSTIYTVGEITRPDSYNDDPRLDCTNGIHFFLTKEEAEEW